MDTFQADVIGNLKPADKGLQGFQNIVQASGPPPPPPDASQPPNQGLTGLKTFVASPFGIGLLSFVVFFVLLLILRPAYIMKSKEAGSTALKINFIKVFLISLVCAAIVCFVPLIICKTCK